MFYVFVYIANVVLVNWLFTVITPLTLPGGDVWPPASLIVGFTFVLRDYAQREVGHSILPAMLVGGAISWFMAGPDVAFASVAAFLTSEFLDWAVYTWTGRPFSQRVLLSSLFSTPVDSAVFLALMGFVSVPSVLLMTLSKMVGSIIVYYMARRREKAPDAKGAKGARSA